MKETIHHNTKTHLSFLDRLRVLLGKPIMVDSTIDVRYNDGEIEVLRSASRTRVSKIWKRKRKGGLHLQSAT